MHYSSKQWIIMKAFALIMLIQIWFKFGECFNDVDWIERLPGQPSVSFQQFGGYITIDEHQNRSLFYYFVEAQSYPSSKPLVLWLNGGNFNPTYLYLLNSHFFVTRYVFYSSFVIRLLSEWYKFWFESHHPMTIELPRPHKTSHDKWTHMASQSHLGTITPPRLY